MDFELESPKKNIKSSKDFYIDFSLKLLAALKEKVRDHNVLSSKKTNINQLINTYCEAASTYIQDTDVDINTYSMAKVNEFLTGSKEEVNFAKAKEEMKKKGLGFDFQSFSNLYISSPKDKHPNWFEI